MCLGQLGQVPSATGALSTLFVIKCEMSGSCDLEFENIDAHRRVSHAQAGARRVQRSAQLLSQDILPFESITCMVRRFAYGT